MRVFKVFACILIVLTFSSCMNPLSKWFGAQKKVDTTQALIQKNEDKTVEAAQSYVFATQIAIQADPSTNKYHKVTSELNQRAVTVLGTPPLEQVLVLKQMVADLLSENQKTILKGEEELAKLDERVIILQTQKGELENKLETAEKKLVEVGSVNSKLAQTYQTIKNWFWRILWGIVIIFAIKIICQFLPSPYDNLGCIVSIPIALCTKLVHALMPDVKKYAGVVGNEYKTTVEHLSHAIEELKEKHPEIKESISSVLLQNTDSNSSQKVISKTKTELGI